MNTYLKTQITKILDVDGSFIWEARLYKHTMLENQKIAKDLIVSIQAATKTEASNARFDLLKNYQNSINQK